MEDDLKEFLEAKRKASEGDESKMDYDTMLKNQQSSFMKNMPKMPTGFKMPSLPKIKL